MEYDGMFRELLERSDDIVIITDPEFKIRYVSSSVRKIFDLEPVRVVGTNLFTYVDSQHLDDWKARMNRPGLTSFKEEIKLKIRGRDSYFNVEVSNLTDQAAINGLMIKLHDITQIKTKEEALRHTNQQLDQVIYKTTHDLRAPLMSAIGLVNLAEKATPEEQPQLLSLIRKSLLKLDSFIDEMNGFFRNEKLAIQKSFIDVQQLLSDELSNFEDLVREQGLNISVEVNQQSDLYSDSIRLRTIVGNILSNAVKYFDQKKSEPFIKISVSIDEDFYELRFDDNGIGIEKEYHQKIFDIFFRATSASEGTGLGLFIVKDTIERLSGKIQVQSNPGEGSTFIINLPNLIRQPDEVVSR